MNSQNFLQFSEALESVCLKNPKNPIVPIKRFDCSKLRLATPEEVKQEIGLEIGAVCPLFLDLPMLIDRRIFNREKINFGSGDHLFGIEIKPKDILKCVEAKISDIVV